MQSLFSYVPSPSNNNYLCLCIIVLPSWAPSYSYPCVMYYHPPPASRSPSPASITHLSSPSHLSSLINRLSHHLTSHTMFNQRVISSFLRPQSKYFYAANVGSKAAPSSLLGAWTNNIRSFSGNSHTVARVSRRYPGRSSNISILPSSKSQLQVRNNFSYAGPRKLGDILKIEQIQDKSKVEISDLWMTYHEGKEKVHGLILDGDVGKSVLARAAQW